METQSRGSLLASSAVRPLRVAFLVHQDTATPAEIAQIVRHSSSCWGGAYHGIFPTNGREVPGQWSTLLKLLDPDVIYSLAPLDETFVLELARTISKGGAGAVEGFRVIDRASERFVVRPSEFASPSFLTAIVPCHAQSMERLHRTVVQIEEAKRFIVAGDVPRLALALILLDNAAEVMMRRIVEDELDGADMYGRMLAKFPDGQLDAKGEALRNDIARRTITADRRRAIRKFFPEKVKFLSEERNFIQRPVGRVLIHLHSYRNEVQHHDRVRPGSIRPAVLILFDICIDLLVRLQPSGTSWDSDGDYTWLGAYGIVKDPPIAAIGVRDLRERIAKVLRSGLSLKASGVRTALVEHLNDRLDGMEDNISAIFGITSIKSDRALALKAVQYWHHHDRMMNIDDAKFESFVPPFGSDVITGWRLAAAQLNSGRDKMELFDRFAVIEDEFEPLEKTLDHVVSAIETAGEAQSDLERGA